MTTYVMPTPELSKSRLLLLGVSSVILCLSFIMSVFAPFPLALAHILYGRALGILVGAAGLLMSYAFAKFFYADLTLFGFYAIVFIFGIGIAEIVNRSISPVKGMVVFGFSFIALFVALAGGFIRSQGLSAEQFVYKQLQLSQDKIAEQKKVVEQSTSQDSIQVLQLLDRPDLMAKELVEVFPSYFFMGVFLMLWFNMFLVLKSRRLLLSGNDYPYSELNLLKFKVPFEVVYLLVIALVLAIWSQELGLGQYENLGMTLLKCLGIFYFFQGFGVFSDLLSFLGVMGFFRSLIVMIVIFMANYMIAVAGLLDNWFDFRKYFVKQNLDE